METCPREYYFEPGFPLIVYSSFITNLSFFLFIFSLPLSLSLPLSHIILLFLLYAIFH